MTDKTTDSLIDLDLPKHDGRVTKAFKSMRGRWARVTAVAAIAAGGLAIGGHMLGGIAGLWEFYRLFARHDADVHPVSPLDAARQTSSRQFRSVAVLPFSYRGLAEDAEVAQTLSRDLTYGIRRAYPDTFVVATSLVQPYKGAAQDLRKIGDALNVRYVVEGNLQRTTASSELLLGLIDTTDGSQLWSDRAEIRSPEETAAILGRLRAGLRDALVNATRRELPTLPAKERAVWELVLRAYDSDDNSKEGYERSQKLFEDALRIDPDFVPALRGLTYTLWQRMQDDPEQYAELVKPLENMSARAVRLAPGDPRSWTTRANALRVQGNLDAAFAASDKALSIEPLDGQILQNRGALMIYAGRPAEALPIIARSLELDSTDVTVINSLVWRCLAYTTLAKDDEAAPICEKAAGFWNRWIIYSFPASSYAHLGNRERARFWKDKLLAVNPRASIQLLRQVALINSNTPEWAARMEHWLDGARKAGVPER